MSNARFEELVGLLIDGELDRSGMDELAQMVREDEELLVELQEQLETEDQLGQEFDILRAKNVFLAATLERLNEADFVTGVYAKLGDSKPSSDTDKRVHVLSWQWLSLMAAILLLGTVGYFMLSNGNSEAREVATISELYGEVQWTGDRGQVTSNISIGDSIHGGTIETLAADAWAKLEFVDGTEVTVFGQSMMTLSEEQQKVLHLRNGSMSATVTPQPDGQPMLIQTPAAQLEVVGTQLNVNAGDQATQLSVNQGHVRLTRLSDGKKAEVPANHEVVASLASKDLKVYKRPAPLHRWQSRLPHGIVIGKWVATPGTPSGNLKATPLLLKYRPEGPITLQAAAIAVSRCPDPPIVLRKNVIVRLKGRLNRSQRVYIGLTTTFLRRGFAGKYRADEFVETSSEGGEFELELPLSRFLPEETSFPASPIGLRVHDWWCFTVEDAGLEVTHVKLLHKSRSEQFNPTIGSGSPN